LALHEQVWLVARGKFGALAKKAEQLATVGDVQRQLGLPDGEPTEVANSSRVVQEAAIAPNSTKLGHIGHGMTPKIAGAKVIQGRRCG
jgi:hypothetical protein